MKMAIIMNGRTDCISYLQNVIFKDIIRDITTQAPNNRYISNSVPVKPDKHEELLHKMCDFATKSLLKSFANLTSKSEDNETLNWPETTTITNFSSTR